MSIKDPDKAHDAQDISALNHAPVDQGMNSAVPETQSQTVDQEGPGLSAELSLAEPNVSKEKLCGVCNEKASKYKCTRCYLPYCSIVCSTLHKATHSAIESIPTSKPKPVASPKLNTTAPRLGTVAAAGYKGPFSALDDSQELQTLFKSYPRLPSQLDEINTATLQPIDDQDTYSRSHYPRSNRKGQSWNQDLGIQNGVQALQRAKQVYGKDGEGVREFSKLVLQIVSKDSTVDTAALIQKEIAEENARFVSQLLNGEL